jgi:hypothetical protein
MIMQKLLEIFGNRKISEMRLWEVEEEIDFDKFIINLLKEEEC